MKMTRLVLAVLLAAVPVAAGAATFIIPAAGTGPGAGGSQWQTELVLHNTSATAVDAELKFHDRTGVSAAATVNLAPRATVRIDDVVKTRFDRQADTGAIEVVVPELFASKVAVTSRTFNKSAGGQYGQDIPAYRLESVPEDGVTLVLNGPSSVAESRFNFGIYAVADTTIRWQMIRADGSVAATAINTYAAGTQTQYNGAAPHFNVAAQNDDVVVAAITQGAAFVYGSVINDQTGDPTYVPGLETRPDIKLQFAGVDYDFNGNIEIFDADRDGVLDQAVDLYYAQNNFFRVVVNDPEVSFEQLPSDAPTVTIAPDGAVSWGEVPWGVASATLKLRITTRDASDVIRIPIRYR